MSNARSTGFFISSALLVSLACTPVSAVIYGQDDRKEYYDASPEWKTLAQQSVAALIPISDLDVSNPNDVTVIAPTLGDYQGLCDDERFISQPTAAFCSGTLIDDDLILTAGHCIENASECAGTRLVFKYLMSDPVDYGTITTDEVFQCQEIIARESRWDLDYAIIRLDRPAVPNFAPVSVVRGGLFEYGPPGGQVISMGHPHGIPVKIADNAEVKESHPGYFEANLDHFGGNSGSGVYSGWGEQVGILVRGEHDYHYDHDAGCYRSNVCSDESGCDPPSGSGFEEVTRSTNFAHWLPPRCADGLCDPEEDEFVCPDDCPQDSDHDLVEDEIDNCPWLPNTLQENFDGDPLGDACDCDWINGDFWSTPGEVLNLALFHDPTSGWTILTWDPPLEPGATSVVYDTLRSELPMDFLGPVHCVESDDGANTHSEDPDYPPSGMVYYYLVRAQSACPAGHGPLGGDWRGKPRDGRACP